MTLHVGEHSGFSTRPVYRAAVPGTGRYRDTTLTKMDGKHYASTDTSRTTPLPVSRYRARTRYRDRDGRIRVVQAEGPSKAEAERNLRRKLADRGAPASPADGLHPGTPVTGLWEAHRAALARRDYAAGTFRVYDRLARLITDDMGGLAVREVSTQRAQQCIDHIEAVSGPTTAGMARTLLTAMFGTAARAGAADRNPVRDTLAPVVKRDRVKAPTMGEVARIRDALAASTAIVPPARRSKGHGQYTVAEYAHRLAGDVADVVTFASFTGCRISEIFALRWADLDLAAGTATIAGHVIAGPSGTERVDGAKTAAGVRTVPLAADAVAMLMDRQLQAARPGPYVFGNQRGKVRDLSSFYEQWRRVRGAAGAEGVGIHDFRRALVSEAERHGYRHRMTAMFGWTRPDVADGHYIDQHSQLDRSIADMAQERLGGDAPRVEQ